jgi:hypothetical protein
MSLINRHIVSKFEKSIGNGTTNRPEYPCYFFYDYGYFAFIYKKSELGIGNNVWITGIRFEMDATDSPQTNNNQTLKLAQVNRDEFDINIRNDMTQSPNTGWAARNITTVKSNFTWSITSNTQQFYTIKFDTPFRYDASSSVYPNLLIIWENRDGSYLSGSTSPWSECFTDGTFRSYYDYQDNSMPNTTDYGTRASNGIPNIELIFEV